MRRIVISLIVLVCLTSLSFAQGMTQKKEMMGKGMMQGKMMGHNMGGMHSMMYSGMLHHTLMMANTLDLTDAQKKKLETISDKYLYPMIQKEGDFKISHMKIMDNLHDPNFDPDKLRAEIKKSTELNLEMANTMVDGIAAVREAIGSENYAKITKMMPMMGEMKSEMMQQQKGTQVEEKEENPSTDHEEHH